MSKKKFFAGLIATIVALGSTALACHISLKKNAEKQNSDDNKGKNQYKKETAPQPTKDVEIMKTMYGIPANIDKPWDPSMGTDMIIIEKYGLPPISDENIKKYAVPEYTNEPKEIPVLKYATPYIYNKKRETNIVKYASPKYFQEKDIVPVEPSTEVPVLKYATPYIENKINKFEEPSTELAKYAIPSPEHDKDIKDKSDSSNTEQNPWK